MTEQLQKKVNFAIKLLRSIPQDKGDIELCYSGGKDSDVILELAKMAEIPFRAIYKSTTIDPPGTIAHCKENGVEIVRPKKSFFQLIREKGMPSRFIRHCCSALKEYKICETAIVGVRRGESKKRAKLYKEPEMCRVYRNKEKVRQYFPILEWDSQDVEEFITERNIKVHPLYYDENGKLDVTRRLGCLGCPLASRKKRIEVFKKYPKMLKLWIGCQNEYLKNHTNTKSYILFNGDPYKNMFFALFCDDNGQLQDLKSGGLFPELELNFKEYLENYFNIDLTL